MKLKKFLLSRSKKVEDIISYEVLELEILTKNEMQVSTVKNRSGIDTNKNWELLNDFALRNNIQKWQAKVPHKQLNRRNYNNYGNGPMPHTKLHLIPLSKIKNMKL